MNKSKSECVPQEIQEAWDAVGLGEFPENHKQACDHVVGDTLADYLVMEWVESADEGDLRERPVAHMIEVVERGLLDLEKFRAALSRIPERTISTISAEINYESIRKAMGGKPYTCSLCAEDARFVIAAVNQGIDSHLEACNIPDRGDRYEAVSGKLECSISPESFPVLLRRLLEMDIPDGTLSSVFLAENMLTSLGFNENGVVVGREALGLE